MAELRNNYSDVDYSMLKKDSEQFHKVAEIVNDSKTKRKKRRPRRQSRLRSAPHPAAARSATISVGSDWPAKGPVWIDSSGPSACPVTQSKQSARRADKFLARDRS